MPVHPDVVKEVLVDRILAQALAREPAIPTPPVRRALVSELDLPACDGGPVDLRLRGIGYLARGIEAEMFDPARQPLPGLGELLRERIASGDDWPSAAIAISCRFARTEPLPKPKPGDDHAVSWKVPGPGGHVRHYVVAAAIAEVLREGAGGPEHVLPSGITEAGELKRSWTYGFIVRCCEEALPPEQSANS